jgi:hypothetical protein
MASDFQKMPFEIIEKDSWVVWILARLFSLDKIKSSLTFKGGTSLSKIYRTIDRFSEDIDISIERELLGFDHSCDPERAPSRKKQQGILESLSKACSNFVQSDLLTSLHEAIYAKFKTSDGWRVFIDPEDPDLQTLLFEYPSKTSKSSYIRPWVKIEIGARSEHWPVSDHKIESYAKEALQDKLHEPDIWVRVLNVERTFWEKATILHQYYHLPEHKSLPLRISRHFYDFYKLLTSDVKEKALLALPLLERVATHKSIYFASCWANYQTALKGTLKLIPPVRILSDLERDYGMMQSMFFRDIPDWNLILKTIQKFETEFNA